MTCKRLTNLALFSFILFFITPAFSQTDFSNGYSDLALSPQGDKLLLSIDNSPGLYLMDLITGGNPKLICPGKGASYRAQWSADGNYAAFKKITQKGLQSPCIYSVSDGKIIELCSPVMRSGIPSFSRDMKIAYTIDKVLFITDLNGKIILEHQLPAYANQTPVSPDGQFVIYNDFSDDLYVLDLIKGESTKIQQDSIGKFGPVWSPDGSAMVSSSLNGDLHIYDLQSRNNINLGKGQHPVWSANGNKLYFSRYSFIPEREILDADLFCVDKNGLNLKKIDDQKIWADFPAVINEDKILFSDRKNGQILEAGLSAADKNNMSLIEISTMQISRPAETFSAVIEGPEMSTSQTGTFFDIPLVHQRYDTPDWFNGNWACGAASAIMCIAYYDLVEKWPVWVSIPYKHISPYGNYICSVYNYDGFNFNIWASDPDGIKGYGGYGHIVRNNPSWRDTKGYMADYANKHGLSSWVDWGPSRSKVITEVDAKMPFVLLNSLTTSGHYISVIGYEDENATTLIVNDPYGNKNNGYSNFYGRRTRYDWPGYTNGYENLNGVHCYIYFHGEVKTHADLSSSALVLPDTIELGKEIVIQSLIRNEGDKESEAVLNSIILSEDGDLDYYDRNIEFFDTDIINASDSLKIEKNITIMDSLVSNYYYLGVYADCDSVNLDMVPENNWVLKNVKIFGYPRINAVYPNDESETSDNRIRIYAKYREKFGSIDTTKVKLIIDGQIVTDKCEIEQSKIVFDTDEDYSPGLHNVRVEVVNSSGLQSNLEWSFSVDAGTAVDGEETALPKSFSLSQNYPNPFNPETVISYTLPVRSHVKLTVYNLLGEKTAVIVDKLVSAGKYKVRFDGSVLPAGIYFYRISAGNFAAVRKMILIK